ncbi:hypothetical protein MPTK1_8g10630 [Marchantia polymorpha subsp. ruderalis]|uniref:Uncharacterized protein n=1 Tax=Marchantia polymorpha TaxID=3197 RepID=A0A2R6XMR7_MARPO|nr:hypothetical protein MARPO_0008s0160 [Marchantia polymorpha]BBN19428.1 hypothetical protein Mp_8g10630 [Marchantia polymorpha subsp. ruderalis]|eukprot:PTQ47404.1 hypothetical protein MARPO_0008s0160 [Marchantia polymorpha]
MGNPFRKGRSWRRRTAGRTDGQTNSCLTTKWSCESTKRVRQTAPPHLYGGGSDWLWWTRIRLAKPSGKAFARRRCSRHLQHLRDHGPLRLRLAGRKSVSSMSVSMPILPHRIANAGGELRPHGHSAMQFRERERHGRYNALMCPTSLVRGGSKRCPPNYHRSRSTTV